MKTQLVNAAAILAATTTMALAEYPDRAVSFVVPFPPGDLEDILTRMIAEDFSEAYGVPAAVVNMPGGGGGPFPGAISVAGEAADGGVELVGRLVRARGDLAADAGDQVFADLGGLVLASGDAGGGGQFDLVFAADDVGGSWLGIRPAGALGGLEGGGYGTAWGVQRRGGKLAHEKTPVV